MYESRALRHLRLLLRRHLANPLELVLDKPGQPVSLLVIILVLAAALAKLSLVLLLVRVEDALLVALAPGGLLFVLATLVRAEVVLGVEVVAF